MDCHMRKRDMDVDKAQTKVRHVAHDTSMTVLLIG